MSEHKPFVPPEANVRELTPVALIMGAVLGIIFALSSVYLGLKVGLTVSASIPVAVLSITLFRWLKLRGTILENNIAQTTGSAGESLAAGVAFTLPSLLLMGFDMELMRVLLVALLGGLIGVLMMIPLRHGLIVKEHGKLAYPEGTACADVLIVGEKGGTEAKTVFIGFFVGLFYAFGNLILKLWHEVSSIPLNLAGRLKGATVGFEVSPPMLGVGYIIGPKVAANMLGGGLLAFVVLIPLIVFFGDPETVGKMSPGAIRNNYILYIGAGAVAAGGFIALGRAIPTIVQAFKRGIGDLKPTGGAGPRARVMPLRTERDLPMTVVIGGSVAIALTIWIAPILEINFFTSLLVVLFGFFFVTVSSRITGEIGSSSNPISGMTIATLLLTCGLFVALGWTGVGYKAMALTTAALVCVAASNGGTISQDLKTGFLVGATPRLQQIAILVGVVSSAVVIGFTLLLLNDSRTTYPAVDYPAYTVAKTSDQTMKGPDGKSYKVAYLQEEVVLKPAVDLPVGTYLVDDAGAIRHAVGKDGKPIAREASGYVAPAATGPVETRTVDDKAYRVLVLTAPVKEAGHKIPRGKYLVDGAGKLAFLVDPGVSGTYPYKLEKASGKLPDGVTTNDKDQLVRGSAVIGADRGQELGVDHLSYRAIELTEEVGGLRPGKYLVDPNGSVVYFARSLEKFDAPKAQLFRLIIDGTLGGDLPWGLVLVGVLLAIILELIGVSSLPFAVGLYLPIYTSGGIFVGGAVRWLVDRRRKSESAAEAEFSPGMLMASGLIAGGAIAGVVQSIILILGWDKALDLSGALPVGLVTNETWWPLGVFLVMAAGLFYIGNRKKA